MTLIQPKEEKNMEPNKWRQLTVLIKRQRVIARNRWVTDEEYVRETGDASAKVGDRIPLTPDEVRAAMDLAQRLAAHLARELREKRCQLAQP